MEPDEEEEGSWSRGFPVEDCLWATRGKAPGEEELAWDREMSRTC